MRKPRRSADWLEYEKVKKYANSEKKLKKFPTEGYLKAALIYPNSYSLLAGNLGFSRVFEIANSIADVTCQRFFFDKRFTKFYSLDSLRPLDEFKVWMFSISYELDFFNLLEILKRFKVPLLAKEREDVHPLILIGGPLVSINPELFTHIADIIYHGEAEVNLENILYLIVESIKLGRKKLLEKVTDLEGISIPILNKKSLKDAVYHESIYDPASSVFLSKYGEFGERILIETGRGCFRKCKFCTIGNLYGYFRPVKVDAFIKKINALNLSNGAEIGLVAPAVNDHPRFNEILDFLEKKNLKFSLSSLRIDKIDSKLLEGLLRSGQNMLTVAPETGSEKLRKSLNKNINDEEIFEKILMAKKMGFKKIKIYLMIGLPEETNEDLFLTVKMLNQISKMEFNEIVVSINPFIPKPGTPFGNYKFLNTKKLLEKQKVLKVDLKNVKVNFESLREGIIQYKLDHLNSNEVLEIIHAFDKSDRNGTIKILKKLI